MSTERAKRKAHRACDYCREHRIKCVYEDSEICKHCMDFDIRCEKVARAPKDERPRKRLMSRQDREGGGEDIQGLEPEYLGYSSLSQLAWSLCPARGKRKLHLVDLEYDLHRGAICDSDEQGVLVGRPASSNTARPADEITFDRAQARLAERVGSQTVLRSLYETASTRIIPIFPVISKHESLLRDEPDEKYWSSFVELHPNSTPPTPLPAVVRVIHCALAAMSREVPEDIRRHTLALLQHHLDSKDYSKLYCTPSLSSIQVLVLLTMNDELNEIDHGGGDSWLKLGNAVRMAQTLALHRKVSLDAVPLAQMNRRARVWGACLCADRWLSLRRGQPFAIDLDVCDNQLPQAYPDHVRDEHPGRWTPAFRFMSELTKLSILLGRVYKLTNSPVGIFRADDASLLVLQTEIDLWAAQLPVQWPYSPTLDTPDAADLINAFRVVLEFTLLKPFMWSTTPVPPHVSFRPPPQRWSALVLGAQQATEWAETVSGTYYLDVWTSVSYAIVHCFFVHLQHYSQTRGEGAKSYLIRADRIIQLWAEQTPLASTRRKVAAMTGLLRETADALESASPQVAFDNAVAGMNTNEPLTTLGFDQIVTPGGSLSENWLQEIGGINYMS